MKKNKKADGVIRIVSKEEVYPERLVKEQEELVFRKVITMVNDALADQDWLKSGVCHVDVGNAFKGTGILYGGILNKVKGMFEEKGWDFEISSLTGLLIKPDNK